MATLRLTTFGGVALTRGGGPVVGVAGKARRLAILALLAAAGARGVERRRLATLLWPESDERAGGHSLTNELSAMRGALGGDYPVVGTATLHLDPALVSADAWEFEGALRARHLEAAVELHAGPFADQLRLDGAPDAEDQLAAARARYERECAAALRALADAAGARGDAAGATRWLYRLLDAEPLSERAAVGLVTALDHAGERQQALAAARAYAERVRRELGAQPGLEFARAVARLQGAPPAARGPVVVTPPEGIAAALAGGAARREERRVARLTRALGGRYRLAGLVREGSTLATYRAAAADGPGGDVEVHVVQPELVVHASPDRYAGVFAAVVGLSDARVLPTLDFGADEDCWFFVTARGSPASLRARLKAERELPVCDAVAVARDVAAAVAHAHARGVCHGDLRPKHVGLGPGGAVVGMFGVAEACAPARGGGDHSTVVAFGSPPYQSPERLAEDAPVDARGDVYAFGAVLYEMLVGEPPFGRSGRGAQLGGKFANGPPPSARAYRASVPEALDRVVQTCLARVPADRYASGADVVRALGEH